MVVERDDNAAGGGYSDGDISVLLLSLLPLFRIPLDSLSRAVGTLAHIIRLPDMKEETLGKCSAPRRAMTEASGM